MDVKLHEIGAEMSRVVVVDDFLPDAYCYVEVAAALAPYDPEASTYYPGLRRIITPADTDAEAYAAAALEAAAPFIGGAFDADAFDLVEASFSLVTHRPEQLKPAQRNPHFDSVEPGFLAVLHYLTDIPNTGTCFYRHRATGFERMTQDRLEPYGEAQAREAARLSGGFIGASDARYEQLLRVDGRFNRLLIYQGSLLHSGFIPGDFAFSSNPRTGRLTGNLFIQIR